MIDRVVESYIPLAARLETNIERLEDEVVNAPRPAVLANISEARATLLELRRVLNATRHIVVQLRHVPGPLINQELSPFLRDLNDDLAIILDNIAADRDRLAGALDLYMSSIANRNAEATKTLTLLGTAALPALVVTSAFGMNIEYPLVMITSLAVTLFSSVVRQTERLPARGHNLRIDEQLIASTGRMFRPTQERNICADLSSFCRSSSSLPTVRVSAQRARRTTHRRIRQRMDRSTSRIGRRTRCLSASRANNGRRFISIRPRGW